MSSPSLAEVLGVGCSVLQSGMGGVAGPELAAAVSAAGGAGCLGGYKLTGPDLSMALQALVAATDGPVGVNLIPEVVGADKLASQVEQVLAESPAEVFLFFFGTPPDEILWDIRAARRTAVVQVGTVDDAVRAAEFCDVVVAQGVEAGGHLLGTQSRAELLAEIRAELPRTCVVGAGGIGGPNEAAAARSEGADGVCAGTAYVVAQESRAHSTFKSAVIDARPADTVITSTYHIGWPNRRHRVLRTAVTENSNQPATFIAKTTVGDSSYLVPRYSAATPTVDTTGRIEQMAQYCGLSCVAIDTTAPAAAITRALAYGFNRST